jgi:hypothetical protein
MDFKAKADADKWKSESRLSARFDVGSIPLSGAVKIHAKLPDPLARWAIEQRM